MQLDTPKWSADQLQTLRKNGDRTMSAAGLVVTITAEGLLFVEIPVELQREIVESATAWVT